MRVSPKRETGANEQRAKKGIDRDPVRIPPCNVVGRGETNMVAGECGYPKINSKHRKSVIFDELTAKNIPYLVIRFKVSSPLTDGRVGRYAYQIIAPADRKDELRGFNPERFLRRYGNRIVVRNLKDREIGDFLRRGMRPVLSDACGTIWDCGGFKDALSPGRRRGRPPKSVGASTVKKEVNG